MKRLVSLPVIGLLGLLLAEPSHATVTTFGCGSTGSDFDGNCSLEELIADGSIEINGILFDSFGWNAQTFEGTPLGPNSSILVTGIDSRSRPGLVFTDEANAWDRAGLTVTINNLQFRIRNQNANPVSFQNFRMHAVFGAISGFDLGEQEDSSVFIKDRPYPTAFGPDFHGEAVVQCFASEVQTLGADCANTTRRDSHTGAQDPGEFLQSTDMTANMDFNIIAETTGHAQLKKFVYQLELPYLVSGAVVPDMNGNGTPEIAILEEDKGLLVSTLVEVRDSRTRARLSGRTFFDNTYTPLAIASLPDLDGNGVPELAVLARLDSTGGGFIQIKNASGPALPRSITLSSGHVALGMRVVDGDIDNDGDPELAVLLSRVSDGREKIEIVDAFGPANSRSLAFSPSYQVIDFSVVDDGDGDGVPEIAALCGRFSDGRYLVINRNSLTGAAIGTGTLLPIGDRPERIVTVADANADGVPELAILQLELATGATLVQVISEFAPANSRTFAYPGSTDVSDARPLTLLGLPDTNGDGVPEIALLVDDGPSAVIKVYLDNARGTTTRRIKQYPVRGYDATPFGLGFLDDADGNGSSEIGLLASRNLDGQLQVHIRNVFGPASPWIVSFDP